MFLKSECKRIKDKIYSFDKQNIKFSQKKTKFEYSKYNIKDKKKPENIIEKNNIIKWINIKLIHAVMTLS